MERIPMNEKDLYRSRSKSVNLPASYPKDDASLGTPRTATEFETRLHPTPKTMRLRGPRR